MSLTFYHSVESTCAQKVRLVMAEKSLGWDERRLNLRNGDQFSPDYLKLNPKAVVPTLVDDEIVVRESTVINEYLEDKFPDPALRPKNPAAKAKMRLLIKSIDDEVHGATGILSYAVFLRHQMNERLSEDELAKHFAKVADPGRRERQQLAHEKGLASPAAGMAMSAMSRFVVQLAEAIGDAQWLVDGQYTLADAAALPYMMRARAIRLSPLWKRYPALDAWLERGQERVIAMPLSEPWGSDSFHDMVSGYADSAEQQIGDLINGV